jgi:hypothetical protein
VTVNSSYKLSFHLSSVAHMFRGSRIRTVLTLIRLFGSLSCGYHPQLFPVLMKTLPSVSAPCKRAPAPRAPLAPAQRKERKAATQAKQEKLQTILDDWQAYTKAKVQEAIEQLDVNERYVLDLFFNGGAKFVLEQNKVNPHNAFKSKMAWEVNEGKLLYAMLWSCPHDM